MSEPDAGSAVTELTTSAKPDGKHYVINGSKVFSTFSPDAKVFLVYVRYGPGSTASARCWSSATRPASPSARRRAS